MPPATHRISIFKKFLEEKWSNDYLIAGTTMDEAATIAGLLVTWERNIHFDGVTVEYWRASTTLEGDRTFRHTPVNLPGLLATGTNEFLPLYCTYRLDMKTNDSDPARKYYRAPVPEVNQINGQLTSGAKTSMGALIVSHFQAIITQGVIVTTAGNLVTAASWHPYIQERQLHRRKRKKILVNGVFV